MQHEHVLAEHEHAAIHRRRIRDPACAGAFAAHRIREIDGGVHRRFHLHLALHRTGRHCDDDATGHLGSIVHQTGLELDVECWAPARDLSELDAWRFFSFTGTSFIPHFGQFPG